jgi:cyclophilin family peptidyl-prolyl cis-trans isomerase
VWNPLDWFHQESGYSAFNAKLAEKARKNAERAQLDADRALQEAMRAKEQAEKARKAADTLSALQSSSPSTAKPSAGPPASAGSSTAVTPADTADAARNESDGSDDGGKLKLSTPYENLGESQSGENRDGKDVSLPSSGAPPEESVAPKAIEDRVSTNEASSLSVDKKSADKSADSGEGAASEAASSGLPGWNPLTWFGGEKHHKASRIRATSDETPGSGEDTAPAASAAASESSRSRPAPADTPSSGDEAFPDETVQASAVTESVESARPSSVKARAAVIETEKGAISIELYPDQAPLTVANFARLISEGFYNKFNMRFHRVIPGFVIQTGDPTGTGAGGSKKAVPLEVKNKLSHNAKGVVAMARGGDPGSATSQFYITLAPQTVLDGKYAIFGKVIGGLDVLDKIEKGDMLYGVRLADIKTVARDPQPEKKKFFSSLF